MGLFNWFRWQLERRAMLKEMDRLRADLSETEKKLYYAKLDLGEVEQLLHEAQSGAKLAAEEQDKLKTQLELHKSAAGYWETQAKQKQHRIEVFGATIEKLRDEIKLCRHQANTLTNVNESTEPAETELERMAWELYSRLDLDEGGAFRQAESFIAERNRRRQAGMTTTDVTGD